jgi:integrase
VPVKERALEAKSSTASLEASNDYVPLDPAFAQILLDWKGDRTHDLVFPSPITGGCYNAGTIQQQILKPALEKIGFTGAGLGWHVFRHTYRSLLDETGAPVGVQQKLMRHSNVATTMNVYGSASLRAKQLANSKVVQMVIAQEPQAKTA